MAFLNSEHGYIGGVGRVGVGVGDLDGGSMQVTAPSTEEYAICFDERCLIDSRLSLLFLSFHHFAMRL